LALQNFLMAKGFPGFSYDRQGGLVTWRGTLQPRTCSPEYQIQVQYSIRTTPKVKVVWPPLALKAPHLYHDGTLCLYWTDEWRWRPDQIIAQTLLPWAALWLYFYELWLDTGEWLGPSSHQTPPADKR